MRARSMAQDFGDPDQSTSFGLGILAFEMV
jgi:hypothetical protein